MNNITKNDIQKAIKKFPGLCDFWTESLCHFPYGWRNDKRIKELLPRCLIKPGMIESLCTKCKPDKDLINSFPGWFKLK